MTEKSLFWTTNGTGDGTSGGYTATEFYDFLRRLLITDQEAAQGVLRGVLNELEVTGSSSPIALNTGAAIAYGFYYENSASLNLTVTTPVVGTTGGRVNLKIDWTAQTVRVVVQLNTDGTASIPSLVQTAGSEWNVPLATFTVTTGGVITLTDARSYCQFANYLTATSFDAITGLSIIGRAANSVGASGAITADTDGEVLQRTGNTLEFGQVATAGITDLAVTTAKIAADAIDDTKAGDRVPQFYRRQGGSSTDWSTQGTTTYTPTAVRMQAGTLNVAISDGNAYGSASVTFPTAFSYKPFILLTPNYSSTSVVLTAMSDSITASGFTIQLGRNTTSGAITVAVNWLAIGPE